MTTYDMWAGTRCIRFTQSEMNSIREELIRFKFMVNVPEKPMSEFPDPRQWRRQDGGPGKFLKHGTWVVTPCQGVPIFKFLRHGCWVVTPLEIQYGMFAAYNEDLVWRYRLSPKAVDFVDFLEEAKEEGVVVV